MAAEAAAVETKEAVAADVAAVETGEGAESASGSVSLGKGGTTLTFDMTEQLLLVSSLSLRLQLKQLLSKLLLRN